MYVSGFPVRFGTRMSGVVDLHLVEPEQPSHGTVDINVLAASADLRGYHGPWSWLLSGRVSVLGEIAGAARSRGEEDIDTPTFNDQIARLSWNDGRNEIVAGAMLSDESLDVERESTGERGEGSYRYTQQQFLHEVQIDEGLTELDPPQHADQVNLGLTWAPRDGLSLSLQRQSR